MGLSGASSLFLFYNHSPNLLLMISTCVDLLEKDQNLEQPHGRQRSSSVLLKFPETNYPINRLVLAAAGPPVEHYFPFRQKASTNRLLIYYWTNCRTNTTHQQMEELRIKSREMARTRFFIMPCTVQAAEQETRQIVVFHD